VGLATNKVYQGDCIKLFEQIEPGSVDLAFADPPFNIGYDYDVYEDDRAAHEYLDWSRRWMAGVRKALKPTGTFWLAIGDEYAAELKVIAQEVGFTCRSWVIWYYTFGVNCARGFSRSHTHLFHFVCDRDHFTFNSDNPAIRVPSARQLVYADARANPRGRLPDNTWILRPQDLPQGFTAEQNTWYFPRVAGTFKEREGFHGCQMPEQLLGRIIRCSSNPLDLVLDPFAGSGTTLVAAQKLGRRWIGFELSPDYARRVQARLERTVVGTPLDGAEDPLASVPATAQGRRRPPHKPRGTRGKTWSSQANGKGRDEAAANSSKQAAQQFQQAIIAAFKATHQGLSTDLMLAQPEVNRAFIEACKHAKLLGDAATWNRALLRIRKAGKLPGAASGKASRVRTASMQEMDDYSFAAEVAAGQLCVDLNSTLDGLLCDPRLAARYDELAAAFAPGFTPFQYRWAALTLRKRAKTAKKLAQTRFQDWLTAKLPRAEPLAKCDRSEYECPGVYTLSGAAKRPLYVGETLNLRQRIAAIGQTPAWSRLGLARVAVIAQPKQPFGLQAALVQRLQPVMNWQLLIPERAETTTA